MRLSRGALFLGAAITLCSAWLVFYSSGTFARAADQVMQRELQRGHFSGTVLISRGSHVLFAKGYGLAVADSGIRNTLDTKFEIGSITKTFTATLIMQLEQQRRLALTDSICTYIEACPAAWSAVTLRHLLSHTSGIYNLTLSADYDKLHGVPQTREEVLARFRTQPLTFVPGAKFDYSNSNYFLLAMVIEKVTGHTYESVLKQRILEPLDMRDTGVIHRDSILPGHATGYRPTKSWDMEVDSPTDPSWSFGAGSLYSTVGDLQKWSEALDSDRILPHAALERMWQPVKGEYGYGWEVLSPSLSTGNRQVIQHTGLITGFITILRRTVDTQLTAIVLANSLASNPARVAQSLTALALGEHFVPNFERDAEDLTPENLRRYVGAYELGGERYTITSRDGRLYVSGNEHPGLPELELLAASQTELFLRDMDGELIATQDGHGRLTGFIFNQGNSSRMVKKVR